MGEGLVRATVAAAKKSDHIVIVKQPDPKVVILECTRCGVRGNIDLPLDIPKFTQAVKRMEKEHLECAPIKPVCPKCGHPEFTHAHDCAHGIPDTHMAGSERFVCKKCGFVVTPNMRIEGFKFILDNTL